MCSNIIVALVSRDTIFDMKKLKEVIKEAEADGRAVGHFNISNIEGLWGIFNAARGLNLPVVIGVSEGERKFVGVKQARALVTSLQDEFDWPVFLNADHTYSFEGVKEAVDAGFDSVIFDGVKLPIDENVKITKQCVDYAKSKNPDILVEAELGYIGTSSKLLDVIPEGAGDTKTKPEEAKAFVEETCIDLLSPSVGNIHGLVKNGNPKLDIELIKNIRTEAGVPLVLHGGSGIADDDFVKAIEAGIGMVHINTEIRLAYRDAMKKSLQENPDEVAPYKIAKQAVIDIEESVKSRLKLFNKIAG